ncbi:YdcH family protein [Kiloniella sp. b19]|uniref:YdcH family protein n=1 Tax=Kiloniella sp. GXU_MW_B19 TaxID=3141326 RepID=UPI0031D5A4F8
MSQHTPHELDQEFPDQVSRIHELKQSDAHFAKLADEYHEVNRQVHRHEVEIEVLSDEHINEVKKQRLSLKDRIADYL